MKILAIGDITSPGGVKHLCDKLWAIRRKFGIDLCIVNGENASFITGITTDAAEVLLRSGADVITGGNHSLQNPASHALLDSVAEVLRPVNFPDEMSGHGYTIVDTGMERVLVISAMGCVNITPALPAPYSYIEGVLEKCRGEYDLAVLDIHAEATGEKLAVAHSFDGRISVIFGTHTHVATADATVLPLGTGYVTDLGMCGESGGIMGIEVQSVLRKLRDGAPGRFVCAAGKPVADGVIFTLYGTYRCTEIKRIKF